jgi:epoxyqueuosine reductase
MKAQVSSNQVKQKALELGFHKVGIAAVDAVTESQMQDEEKQHIASLQKWLQQGYHADMKWMENPKRQNIRSCMPEVRSLICVALNYYTPYERPQGEEYAKISRYGWGQDYHKVLPEKLKVLATWLQAQGEGIQVRFYMDTGPTHDKFWAQQAGIGWIAKNSTVITREFGSWVFLGEILTNLPLTADAPYTQHCGSCSRCIDACPTNAIVEPFVVDSNRCIAYHTIENRAETLPEEIKPHLQGWVAGCDICQDVCPWNQRFAQETDVVEFQPYPWHVAPKLADLAEISDEEYAHRFPARVWNKESPCCDSSALVRIKPEMLRRNARANLEAKEPSTGTE